MPLTRIPDRYRPGLVKIIALDDRQVAQLYDAIKTCPPTPRFTQFKAAVQSQLSGWKREDVHDILQTLYSLALEMEDDESSADELVIQITNAMRSSGRAELKLSDEAEISFSSHIKTLLSIDSLTLAAKTLGLRTEYQKSFCDVRILTDIRPIFGTQINNPVGAFVGHTLKIEYHEGGEHKDFYVALDHEELGKVRRALDRAESKAAVLKSIIGQSGIPDFDRE